MRFALIKFIFLQKHLIFSLFSAILFLVKSKKGTLDGEFLGAGNRTRTDDLLITNQLLYQLSHTSLQPKVIIAEKKPFVKRI